MEMLVIILGFGFFMLMRRRIEEDRRAHLTPRLPGGLVPGGPSPEGWQGPGVALPPQPPSCSTNQWHLPEYHDIPQEVVERAKQILVSAAPMGHELVERVAGRVWKFKVETHGANEMNPNPHRGVGVRLCV